MTECPIADVSPSPGRGAELARRAGPEARGLNYTSANKGHEMTETTAPPGRQIEDGTHTGETRREEHRVSGEKVIAKIKELLHEGNVRHVVIKAEDGRTLIEFPVTVGVAGALLVPVWAAVGAIAAIVASCSIEVEREVEDDEAA